MMRLEMDSIKRCRMLVIDLRLAAVAGEPITDQKIRSVLSGRG
jgi:hypothetical protein